MGRTVVLTNFCKGEMRARHRWDLCNPVPGIHKETLGARAHAGSRALRAGAEQPLAGKAMPRSGAWQSSLEGQGQRHPSHHGNQDRKDKLNLVWAGRI